MVAIVCEKCGAQSSTPCESCSTCGQPMGSTLRPIGSATWIGPFTSVLPTIPNSGTPQVDSVRVEGLLSDIASQSHFEERYEVRGELARGGMGRVYRAYDQILQREVAIKMMHDELVDSSESCAIRGQFLKEARVGGRLLHPHILSVFDLGVNRERRIYYTMRLVEGASLQHCLDAVDKGVVTNLVSYPLRRIVTALVGACKGIDYAHQNGVLHLDLKPHNILVSGFSEVFVIDWGLARIGDADDTMEMVDLYRPVEGEHMTLLHTCAFGERVVGTPGFMAPEQARGAVASFDDRTDVYGLGGILYFILYGAAPNQGHDIPEILASAGSHKSRRKFRAGILPRGQRVRPETRQALEALETICLKALEPDPDERYSSAETMIVELNEWLAGTPESPAGF